MNNSINNLNKDTTRDTITPENDFNTLRKLNEHLKEIVENNILFMFIELLKKISDDYQDKGLHFDELKNKYLSYFKNNMTNSNKYCGILSMNLDNIDYTQINTSTPIKPTIPQHKTTPPRKTSPIKNNTEPTDGACINNNKCCARTSSGNQCSRNKQSGSDLCGCHVKRQPYGLITQPQTANETVKPKRKERKNSISDNPIWDQDSTDQIDGEIENIDGIDYLINNDTQYIYSLPADFTDNNEHEQSVEIGGLKIVGKKLSDGEITWYTDNDLMFLNH